jgi:hypothetical protein
MSIIIFQIIMYIDISIELVLKPGWFWTSSWKNRSKPGFSTKFKEAVPKTEVLEQPQLKRQRNIIR